MTVLDFQEQLPKALVKKGQELYRKNKVSDLVNIDTAWSSRVQDSDEHIVYNYAQGIHITHTTCTCEDFTYNEHCPHVVAALFAIHDDLFAGVASADPYMLKMVNQLSAEELRRYIVKFVHDSEPLTEDLAEYAEATIDNKAVAAHVDTINKSFIDTEEVNENLEYNYHGSIAAPTALELLTKARSAYQSGNITTAFDMIFAIVSKQPAFELVEHDNYGDYLGIAVDAFLLLDEICSSVELDDYNLSRLTRRASDGLWSEHYTIEDYPIHWIDLLVRHGLMEDKKEDLLEIIDSIAESVAEEAETDSYERLMEAREAIEQGTGRVEKKKPH